MLMDNLISVVVPIYNTSKTIERCVNSILMQTYKNLEIILVDDGSTDNSLEICKKLQEKDSRIIVVSGKNQGVSAARNIGINRASGDYIAFVDSDDYIKPEMYERLINIAQKNNVQLVFCNYEEFDGQGNKKRTDQFSNIVGEKELINNIDIIDHMMQISKNNIFGTCWRTLFDVNILNENSIKFEPGITMSEDLMFMLKCLVTTTKSGVCHDSLYCFFQDGTTTSKYMKKLDSDMDTVNDWIKEYIVRLQTSKEFQRHYLISVANTIVINASNVCKEFSPFSIKERIEYIKWKKKQGDYKLALKFAMRNRKYILRNRWIQMTLINLHLEAILILYHSIKNRNFTKYVEY